jgi:hypothetical protein
VVANCDHLSKLKFSISLPYAFTEHGSIMAASVLNSDKAIEVSIFIARAFLKLRRIVSEYKELRLKIIQIEKYLADHDEQIVEVVKLIKQLLNPQPPPKRRRIGF